MSESSGPFAEMEAGIERLAKDSQVLQGVTLPPLKLRLLPL